MLRILLENFRQGNGALGCPKVQWAFLGKNGCSYVTPVNVPLLTRTNFFTSALVADVVPTDFFLGSQAQRIWTTNVLIENINKRRGARWSFAVVHYCPQQPPAWYNISLRDFIHLLRCRYWYIGKYFVILVGVLIKRMQTPKGELRVFCNVTQRGVKKGGGHVTT